MNDFQITLYQIRKLYYDMKATGKDKEQFRFEYNNVQFEVIFLIDRNPFELLIGVIGHSLAFVLKMQQGFKVDPIPDDIFYKLVELLNLQPGKETFTSFIFLRYLDTHSPTKCSTNRVQPHQLAKYKHMELAQVPEADKIYFCGWLDNSKAQHQVRNLEKTRIMLGDSVAKFCLERNFSSKWTDDPNKAQEYFTPQD